MAYQTNRFCWHGLITPEPKKAGAFYSEVIGWKTTEMDMGGETATMFAAGDVPLAHYATAQMDGVPAHWNNYLRVDDVDKATEAIVKNGGRQVLEPSDIPPGRFSVVATPSGATFSLFHEADEATAEHHPGGRGGVAWTELHSQDLDKDLACLKAALGFQTDTMEIPGGGTYYLLKADGEQRAGVMKAMMDQAPSMWLTWFSVDDCDAACARVKSNGGKIISEPMDMEGIGRLSVVTDNTGAVFGLMKPAV